MAAGLVGDDHRQCGFTGAGRTSQDDGRKQTIGFYGAAQQFAWPQDLLLPDKLIQGARAHPGGERRFGSHPVMHGVGEEVHGPYYGAMVLDLLSCKCARSDRCWLTVQRNKLGINLVPPATQPGKFQPGAG